MTLHLSIAGARPETVTERQVRLWALHDKAATEGERREIERQIAALEKQKTVDVLENDRNRR